MKETQIFTQIDLAGIQLNNRLLRSATEEALADEKGYPTEELIRKYEALARGGIGGIITGFIGVSSDGLAPMSGMMRINSDACVEPLKKMVNRIHALGCPIIAQIAHCGSNGVAGKACRVDRISESDMLRIRDSFIAAAKRAEKAGFDGVQLHCAHGYFLSQTLSGATNHRKDRWGGSEEKRFHLTSEIITEIRRELPSYPILVKINGEEQPKNGIHPKEASRIARRLEDAGVSAIEVSRGINNSGMGALWGKVPAEMILRSFPGVKDLPCAIKKILKPLLPGILKAQPTTRCYNLPAAKVIRNAVSVPVIVVGGIHDLDDIEHVIVQEGFEFVSMSRPLILEPGLIQKYKEGKSRTAKCIECNYCLMGIYDKPLRCYYEKVPKY